MQRYCFRLYWQRELSYFVGVFPQGYGRTGLKSDKGFCPEFVVMFVLVVALVDDIIVL